MVGPVTISIVKTFWDLATSLFDLAGKFREQDETAVQWSRATLRILLIAWIEPLRR